MEGLTQQQLSDHTGAAVWQQCGDRQAFREQSDIYNADIKTKKSPE